MMKHILFIGFIFFSFTCFACLNEEHVSKNGKPTVDVVSLANLRFYKHQDIVNIEKEIQDLLYLKPDNDVDKNQIQNDIAVKLIKIGKYAEAEKILNTLLQTNENKYSYLINLGTLYELQGKNKQALAFIKKAVAINNESHDGSEWFHIKILEFKLQPFSKDNILAKSVLNIKALKIDSYDISNQISYQLSERIPFTPAPDLLMAKVLQEYGDFLADSISIKAAYLIYEMGMDYDKENIFHFKDKRDALIPYFKKYNQVIPVLNDHYLDPIIQMVKDNSVKIGTTIIQGGLDYYNKLEEERKAKERFRKYLIAGSIFSFCTIFFFIIWKRNKRKT